MPKMLSYLSQGADVQTLQTRLNQKPPTKLPPLGVDGVFGPKTLARVKEFQSNTGLVSDGIVGPKTWEKLLEENKVVVPPYTDFVCGNADPNNGSIASFIQQQFVAYRKSSAQPTVRMGFRPMKSVAGAGAGSTVGDSSSSSPIRMLTDAQKAKAQAVYGNSLDFSRIFISNKAGLQGRAFTIAFKDENQVVQIMNCGTFNPSDKVLIHELAHVWQSQHAGDPYKFMKAAVDCQAGAVVANSAETFSDVDVILHSEHPVNFPFSAYAYLPGLPLAQYGAEQMAQACHRGEANIRKHMAGVAANTVDKDNETALGLTAFADRRMTGIVI